MKKAVFMTGATGFVGSNVLARLVQSPFYKGLPVFLLARGRAGKQKLRRLLPGFECEIVCGDIRKPMLGMRSEDLARLKKHDTEVWHIAGNTAFAVGKKEDIFKDNFDGTRNVIGLVDSIGARKFHYMSTAYVAGERAPGPDGTPAVAYEADGSVGQRFRNPYEESKFMAEELVKKEAGRLGIAARVYRIGIAVGHSQTGEASAFTGYYDFFRGIKAISERISNRRQHLVKGLKRTLPDGQIHMPVRIWGMPEATVNISCADYMADIVVRLAESSKSVGKTFHVVNPNPPAVGWLFETSLENLKISGMKVVKPVMGENNSDMNPLERRINNSIEYYGSYISGEPFFDQKNVKEVLGELPLHPVIDKELIGRLLDYAILFDFGRKNPPLGMSSL